ncbi:hypothetical protein AB3N59_12735 [Leptospira sp. WS92.C1]
MKKVLYLLGAGASAKCIPTVTTISSELTDLSHQIFENMPELDGSFKTIFFSDLLANEFVVRSFYFQKKSGPTRLSGEYDHYTHYGFDHYTIQVFTIPSPFQIWITNILDQNKV